MIEKWLPWKETNQYKSTLPFLIVTRTLIVVTKVCGFLLRIVVILLYIFQNYDIRYSHFSHVFLAADLIQPK